MRSVIRGWVVSGLMMAAVAVSASGQVSITPTVGYAFGGGVDGLDARYSLGDDITYGGILAYGIAGGGNFELVFDWNSTDVTERVRSTGVNTTLGEVDVWSLQAGGTYELGGSEKIRPFLSGGLGATIYNPGEGLSTERTQTRFSIHGGLGADAARWIKFGGRVWLSFIDTAGGFWCGPVGCGVGAGGEVLVRWEVYGGINIGGRRR
ncbi:MAG: hypothetical protein ACC682_11185 [Gemmatimonadota bacterium]